MTRITNRSAKANTTTVLAALRSAVPGPNPTDPSTGTVITTCVPRHSVIALTLRYS